MMILAAVLLVIGLIALAGMVARVNQLGSQTAIESNQAILGELAPLSDAIDAGVAGLKTFSPVTATWSPGTTIEDSEFTAADVGKAITGPGIPAGTRIIGFTAASPPTNPDPSVTLSAATTAAGTNQEVRVGAFALWASSNPTIQEGIVAMLEHMQRIEASHGFVMDYEISCETTAGVPDPAKGLAIVHLSDGTVWAEIRTSSTNVFQRDPAAAPAAPCDSVYG